MMHNRTTVSDVNHRLLVLGIRARSTPLDAISGSRDEAANGITRVLRFRSQPGFAA